ncbi:MAG: hypothetical protein KatS3mg101_0858 [Patescibacteria group bacterium]|nr:MAG: hypothetical protein KatS3mg101_0858 [Patescibacteria group bacterium]
MLIYLLASVLGLLVLLLKNCYRSKDVKLCNNKLTVAKRQMEFVKRLLGACFYHENGYTGSTVKVGMIDSAASDTIPINYKMKKHEHGTHVAGIIKNIAPDVTIYSYDLFSPLSGFGIGIRELIKQDVDIINMSISKDSMYGAASDITFYQFEGKKLLRVAELMNILKERGILVVVASGNQCSADDMKQKISELTQIPDDVNYFFGYPVPEKKIDWPIVVTSCKLPHKEDEYTSGFSSFNSCNKTVDCMSYGDNIWSTGLNDYVCLSGTSMAAPQVTGCLALIIDYLKKNYPEMTKVERAQFAKRFLLDGCTYRDVKNFVKYFPETKDRVYSPEELMLFFSESEIIKNNIQFYVDPPKDLEEAKKLYEDIKRKARLKYTILSLGKGIVRMPKRFPDPTNPPEAKSRFDEEHIISSD